MADIKNIFRVVKFNKFLEEFTDVNPKGGISHRFSGKGTAAASKTKDLTPEDTKAIVWGLIKMRDEINTVIDQNSLFEGR